MQSFSYKDITYQVITKCLVDNLSPIFLKTHDITHLFVTKTAYKILLDNSCLFEVNKQMTYMGEFPVIIYDYNNRNPICFCSKIANFNLCDFCNGSGEGWDWGTYKPLEKGCTRCNGTGKKKEA